MNKCKLKHKGFKFNFENELTLFILTSCGNQFELLRMYNFYYCPFCGCECEIIEIKEEQIK